MPTKRLHDTSPELDAMRGESELERATRVIERLKIVEWDL